jgi:hypothetical protein
MRPVSRRCSSLSRTEKVGEKKTPCAFLLLRPKEDARGIPAGCRTPTNYTDRISRDMRKRCRLISGR